MVDVELLYRQHLTSADAALLRSVAGDVTVAAALGSPAVEAAVFGPPGVGGSSPSHVFEAATVSPFLVFAVAVHRTAAALETATFVPERWAPKRAIPLFDVPVLRSLLADPARRYFLAELLASYTRVSSGVTWTRTSRGWRRRRFSELDPLRLAEQLDVVGPAERAGVYRRLGDLALFLLGVFPDAPPPLFPGAGTDRLLRLSGVARGRSEDLEARALLQLLGARWYRAAAASVTAAGSSLTATMAVAGEMADHFDDARRVLNTVTDRFLFPWRERWWGPA